MKLKTLLINLAIIGTGITVAPAQATDKPYFAGDGWGLIKVKGGGDDRRYREHDDDDDRYERGRKDYRRSEANFSNFGGYNQQAIPRDRQLNFKEKLYLQRKKEREENQQFATDGQPTR